MTENVLKAIYQLEYLIETAGLSAQQERKQKQNLQLVASTLREKFAKDEDN